MQPSNDNSRRIGYFPGCSLSSGARDYSESVAAVSAAAGVTLAEVSDWNCCGATAAHATNKKLALALAARNLALAAADGLDTVMAPCAACYNRLASVNHELSENASLRAEIEEIIARKLSPLRVMNALEYAAEVLLPSLSARLKPLTGLRLAPYYGCLLVRPPRVVGFDDAEDPRSMDDILKTLGAEPIDWEYKVECCGGGHSLSRTDIVLRLSKPIIHAAREAKADGIVTACPMCHSNLDMRQLDIMKIDGAATGVPIYYLTQIIGLAAGLDETALGIRRHFVPAEGLLAHVKKAAV
jgi:heterodisulfide reductase subunit B2